MPEVDDQYIEAEIVMPRDDEMVSCHFVTWTHNTSENVMERAHTNPILHTRMYQVEFAGAKLQS